MRVHLDVRMRKLDQHCPRPGHVCMYMVHQEQLPRQILRQRERSNNNYVQIDKSENITFKRMIQYDE